MHVGEILLQHRWVGSEPLARALRDHAIAGTRLASFLVAQGEVDFDDASRALAEQHGVAAALRRHLEHRDPDVARLVPPAFARRHVALPLGRMQNGTLIVCARDPSDTFLDQLAALVEGDIALAVAPAKYLARFVDVAYPRDASGELEIPVEVDAASEHADPDLDFAIDVEMPPEAPPAPRNTPLPVEIKATPAGAARTRDQLDTTIAACKDIDELPWLLDVVMEYVGKRWASALLIEIRERRAVGVRGHGPKLKPGAIKTFVVDLDEPSLVHLVRSERRMIDALPDPPSEDDTVLASLLDATHVMAAPLAKGDDVAYVLVVGDPIDKDPEETEIDLSLLTEAVGDALARL